MARIQSIELLDSQKDSGLTRKLRLHLIDAKTFRDPTNQSGSPIKLQSYRRVLQRYQGGEELQEIPEGVTVTTVKDIPFAKSLAPVFQVGDLFVLGGPLHVCDYAVRAIYAQKDLRLLYGEFRDDYRAYMNGSTAWQTGPDKALSCQGIACSVSVQWSSDGHSYTLREGTSFSGYAATIGDIYLLKASDYRTSSTVGKTLPQMNDWGMSKFVHYYVIFK